MIVYVLAQSKQEGREMADEGYGYTSRIAAEKARQDPKIDSYYRNLLKIYSFDVVDPYPHP